MNVMLRAKKEKAEEDWWRRHILIVFIQELSKEGRLMGGGGGGGETDRRPQPFLSVSPTEILSLYKDSSRERYTEIDNSGER